MGSNRNKFIIKNLIVFEEALSAQSTESIPKMVKKNVEVFCGIFEKEGLKTTDKEDTISRALKKREFTKTLFNSFLCCMFDALYSESKEYDVKHNLTDFRKFYNSITTPRNLLSKDEVKKYNSVIRKATEKCTHLKDFDLEMSLDWKLIPITPIQEKIFKHWKLIVPVFLLIIAISFWLFFKNSNQRNIIENGMLTGDIYYSTEQYDKALKEYRNTLKELIQFGDESHYSDLLSKIGSTALRIRENSYDERIVLESIHYLEKAKNNFRSGSEKYNLNNLQLVSAYEIMFYITSSEVYLDKIESALKEINSNNIWIAGMTSFGMGIFNGHKKKFEESVIYLDKAIQILTSHDNEIDLTFALNHKANGLLELWHISKDTAQLNGAKRIYQKINIHANSRIDKAMSQFGLGHVLRHEYEYDSILGKLEMSEIQIKNTLNVYSLKSTPELFASSHLMLSQVRRDLYFATKENQYLDLAIDNIEKSLKFYSPSNRKLEYYDANYLMAEYLFLRHRPGLTEEICNRILGYVEISLELFNDTNNLALYSQSIALKAECYQRLAYLKDSPFFGIQAIETLYHPSGLDLVNMGETEFSQLAIKYREINKKHYAFTNSNSSLILSLFYEESLDISDYWLKERAKESLMSIRELIDISKPSFQELNILETELDINDQEEFSIQFKNKDSSETLNLTFEYDID